MSSHAQRRPLVWLLVLLAFHIFLLSLQVRDKRGRILLRSWGLTLATPLTEGVYWAVRGTAGFFEGYFFLVGLREDNQRLRRQNAELQVEVARLKAVADLLPRSRDYEKLRQRFDFETWVAGVILLSAPFHRGRMLIDAGGLHGVRQDSAVITPQGIAGRVVAVSPFQSEVELITNAGAGAGALIEGTRLQGVVQGEDNDTGLLRLDYIPNVEPVERGAVVLTSGADQIYPRGLVIGEVVFSEKGNMIYRNVQVRPAVDFSRLEEVLVVAPDSGASSPPSPSASNSEGPR